MKLIKTLPLISAIIIFSINLYSQEITPAGKINLKIFNFTTTGNYKDIKDNKNNFEYYSIVIPETISKNLTNSGNYEITRRAEPFPLEADFKDNNWKKNYIKNIEKNGIENTSDFIISGSFSVINTKLTVRVIIADLKGKEIEIVEHESTELGVQLQETTDLISKQINDTITKLSNNNQKKSTESPFISLYNPLSIVTLGVDSGYFSMFGKWKSLYNETLYISPFIDINLTDNILLSLKITSIQSDSDGLNMTAYSKISMLSSSLSIAYIYRINSDYGFAVTAGGGVTKTKITVNPGMPFVLPLSESNSIDPNLDISVYGFYNISTFTIRAGFLYKRIFFKDEAMDSGVIFAGAGIRF